MTKNIDDDLNPFIGKILRIDLKELSIPLYGKLLEVRPLSIIIEKRDGYHRMISKARIIGIETVGSES